MASTVLMGGSRLGVRNGRIAPVNWTPPDGSVVMVFGSDIPGDQDAVSVGDSSNIRQDVDLTGITLLTFAMKFRQGGDGTNVAFQLRVNVGGSDRLTLKPADGETVEYVKRSVYVADLSGSQAIRVFCEAVTP